MKSAGFHGWNPGEIHWISRVKSGWNLPDFTGEIRRISWVKSGWNPPDFERPIARNGKLYVLSFFLLVATIAVPYLGPALNHFLESLVLLLWILVTRGFSWIATSHFPLDSHPCIYVLTPDHGCSTSVTGRELVKLCHLTTVQEGSTFGMKVFLSQMWSNFSVMTDSRGIQSIRTSINLRGRKSTQMENQKGEKYSKMRRQWKL